MVKFNELFSVRIKSLMV